MTRRAELIDTDLPEDIAILAPGAQVHRVAPHDDVVRAVRYLLYRHELKSGSHQLPQMIAVVSASKGEGVTTVSEALAHVLAAERGTQVCWIDMGDFGSLPPALGQGTRAEVPGIGTTMRGFQSDRSLEKPDASAMRLVTGGDALPDRPSRFHRDGPELDEILKNLAAEYRHIIFDTPPLLSSVDSIGFLRHADAYILVTKQGSTTLKQVRNIAEELRPIPTLGAILNDYRTRTPRFVRRFFRE